jgi:hypothetical protein
VRPLLPCCIEVIDGGATAIRVKPLGVNPEPARPQFRILLDCLDRALQDIRVDTICPLSEFLLCHTSVISQYYCMIFFYNLFSRWYSRVRPGFVGIFRTQIEAFAEAASTERIYRRHTASGRVFFARQTHV